VVVWENSIDVVDYKTGDYKPKSLKGPSDKEDDHGGDYWRQLVFYKMLMLGDTKINKRLNFAVLDHVIPDKNKKFHRIETTIKDEDIVIVEEQLQSTYKNILDHKFEEGCGEDYCKWCDFVSSNFTWNENLSAFLEEEENQDLMEMPDAS